MKKISQIAVADFDGRRTRRRIAMAVASLAIVGLGGWLAVGRRHEAARAVTPVRPRPAKLEVRASAVRNPKGGGEASAAAAADAAGLASEGLAQEVEQLLAGPRQNSIPKIAAVAVRWAAVDPAAAMKFFEKLPAHDLRRDGPSRAAMEAWLKRDAAGALAFAKEAVWRDEANADYLDVVFKSLLHPASADPFGELKRYLDQLPQLESVASQVTQAIGPDLKNNLPAAEAFAESMPAGEQRDMLHRILGGAKAQVFGFAAVEALAGNPGVNPGERLELAGAVDLLVRQTPDAVAAWLETQAVDDIFDSARTRLAVGAYMDEPEKAQRIAAQLFHEKQRLRYQGLFLEYWLRKDFAAAEAWAIASDLPADLVAEKIALVTAPKVVVDYEPKLNATLEIADERMRIRAQDGAVRGWLEQDRPAALKWMEAHAKTETEKAYFAMLARSVPVEKPIYPIINLE